MTFRNAIPELLKLALVGMTFTEFLEYGLKIISLALVIAWTIRQWHWARTDRRRKRLTERARKRHDHE